MNHITKNQTKQKDQNPAQSKQIKNVSPTFNNQRNDASQFSKIQQIVDKSSRNTTQQIVQKSNNSSLPIQRVIVTPLIVQGLAANLNTDNLDVSKGQIDTLWTSGDLTSLESLQLKLFEEYSTDQDNANLLTLFNYAKSKIAKKSSDDADSKSSGMFDKLKVGYKYSAPDDPDPKVKKGLRMWIAGDPSYNISWKAIGLFAQGRLPQDDIELIGDIYWLKKQQTDGEDYSKVKKTHKISIGKYLLKQAMRELSGALSALPGHNGLSYRMAGVATGSVYGGKVKSGNYIQDEAYWSTSALKIDGSAGKWGADGTKDNPRVYYIINGTTGKYINKYADLEHGQHEVLFNRGSVFLVDRIANYKRETFFVHVTEVDPGNLPGNTDLKNPYTGDNQP